MVEKALSGYRTPSLSVERHLKGWEDLFFEFRGNSVVMTKKKAPWLGP